MHIGTKSILFGVHCFAIHPWFVAAAWRRLFGFPWDPRLWCAFFLHDLGYWGKLDMDGTEGEAHVELGGRIMDWLWGKWWGDFSRYHSSYYARRQEQVISQLWFADKLAIVMMPVWLYLPLAKASGEIYEYMLQSINGKYKGKKLDVHSPAAWVKSVRRVMFREVILRLFENGYNDIAMSLFARSMSRDYWYWYQ
jgi:hypothetical protein